MPDGEQRLGVAVALSVRLSAGEPEVVGEGQQALLDAIVQVALQSAAFAVAGCLCWVIMGPWTC
jgi:hypothetical protein